MRSWPLFLALLGFAVSLSAQSPVGIASPSTKDGKPVLPSGPLLQSAPNFSQWEVTYTYADEQKSNQSSAGKPKPVFTGADTRPRQVVTTKTGQIVHEEQTDVSNRKVELWFNGGTQYGRGGDGTVWFEVGPGAPGQQNYRPLPANGFRNLDWISAGNFAGSVPSGNTTCLIFVPGGYQKLDLSDPAQQAARLKTATVIAYIDATSRLPILVRNRDETRVYRFGPPPVEMQSLPADLASQIKQGVEGRARLYAPAPRPL